MIMRFINSGEIEKEERTDMDLPEEGKIVLRSLKNLQISELVLDKDVLNEMENASLENDIVIKGISITGELTEFGEPVLNFIVDDNTEIVAE